MTYVPLEPGRPVPLVAFAIGRRFGNAVQRNRARRRLRAAFEAGASALGAPLPVALLVRARPTVLEVGFDELVTVATGILRAAGGRTGSLA